MDKVHSHCTVSQKQLTCAQAQLELTQNGVLIISPNGPEEQGGVRVGRTGTDSAAALSD